MNNATNLSILLLKTLFIIVVVVVANPLLGVGFLRLLNPTITSTNFTTWCRSKARTKNNIARRADSTIEKKCQ